MSQLNNTKSIFLFCRTKGGKLKTFNIGMSPPSTVSGRYDLLEQKVMEEKIKRLKESSSSDEVICPPSPPSRH